MMIAGDFEVILRESVVQRPLALRGERLRREPQPEKAVNFLRVVDRPFFPRSSRCGSGLSYSASLPS